MAGIIWLVAWFISGRPYIFTQSELAWFVWLVVAIYLDN